MNDPSLGQPPSAYPPPRKSFPVVPLILGVAGLLIALAVVGGLKAFHAVKNNSAEAITVADRFVDDMGKHNYGAAQALFTPSVRARTSAGSLKDIETLVEKHHGTYIAHGSPQWFIQNYNGQTSVRLTYPAQFAQSRNAVSLVLVKTDRGYQVYDARYQF